MNTTAEPDPPGRVEAKTATGSLAGLRAEYGRVRTQAVDSRMGGRIAEAEMYAQHALEIASALGEETLEVEAELELSKVSLALQEAEEVIARTEAILRRIPEENDLRLSALCLKAGAAYLLHQPERTITLSKQVMELATRLGKGLIAGVGIDYMILGCMELNRLQEGLDWNRKSLDNWEALIKNPQAAGATEFTPTQLTQCLQYNRVGQLQCRGEILLCLRRFGEAQTVLQQAIEAAHREKFRQPEALAHLDLAYCAAAEQRWDAAEAAARRALQLARRIPAAGLVYLAWCHLTAIAELRDDPARAHSSRRAAERTAARLSTQEQEAADRDPLLYGYAHRFRFPPERPVGQRAASALTAGEPAPPPTPVPLLLGKGEAMQAVHRLIRKVAPTQVSALIQGETGTGKELAARAIHQLSPRATGPFVAVDCGALPEALVEAELFGYAQGAFTGANRDKPGLFEAAHGGTLFLDEIGNLSPLLQAKLLRVLQEGEVRRLGETQARRIDVRVLAATNADLGAAGRFRADLYYRLNALTLVLPPLRERREDLPLLVEHFRKQFNRRERRRVRGVEPAALAWLERYAFPGNVRELEHLIYRAALLSEGQWVRAAQLPGPGRATGTGPAPKEREAEVAERLFAALSEGEVTFAEGVRAPFLRRELSRGQVKALIALGLEETQGSYKALAQRFHIPPGRYKRFLEFLRRHDCHVDYRPFRAGA